MHSLQNRLGKKHSSSKKPDTITFNFASTINSTSTTGSYADSGDGITITATGTADLFYKSAGVNEIGLGLTNNLYHEIGAGQSITLDLSSLFSKNVTLSLTLDSIERGESATVCDANMMCITFSSSDSNNAVNILSLYADMLSHHSGNLIVTGVTGQVLINELQATTSSVPEPSTLVLLSSGIFMMATGARSSIKKCYKKNVRSLKNVSGMAFFDLSAVHVADCS